MQRLVGVQHGLVARGMDATRAKTAAVQILEGTVARQAMVLSFDWVFVLAGVLFLAVIPLLWFLNSGPSGSSSASPAEVHLEA